MTKRQAISKQCQYCAGEPEAGWIETLNNGPIVPCPVCNPMTERELEYEKAVASRLRIGLIA